MTRDWNVLAWRRIRRRTGDGAAPNERDRSSKAAHAPDDGRRGAQSLSRRSAPRNRARWTLRLRVDERAAANSRCVASSSTGWRRSSPSSIPKERQRHAVPEARPIRRAIPVGNGVRAGSGRRIGQRRARSLLPCALPACQWPMCRSNPARRSRLARNARFIGHLCRLRRSGVRRSPAPRGSGRRSGTTGAPRPGCRTRRGASARRARIRGSPSRRAGGGRRPARGPRR